MSIPPLRFYPGLFCFLTSAQMVKDISFDAEYGCRLSEHDLLRPVIAELEPEVQAYLTEELEDGCQVFYFDGFETNLKRYQMRLLEGESS